MPFVWMLSCPVMADDPREDNNPEQKKDEPMLFCPRCNARLLAHRCKLMCERCGYYMSCADHY